MRTGATGVRFLLVAFPLFLPTIGTAQESKRAQSVVLQVNTARVPTPAGWSVATGVPFHDGQLSENAIGKLRVETESGKAVPAQFEIRGRYHRAISGRSNLHRAGRQATAGSVAQQGDCVPLAFGFGRIAKCPRHAVLPHADQ
jgi:hypothetical protein